MTLWGWAKTSLPWRQLLSYEPGLDKFFGEQFTIFSGWLKINTFLQNPFLCY